MSSLENIKYTNDEAISVYDLYLIIKQWLRVILLTALGIALSFILYGFFSPKLYKVSNVLSQGAELAELAVDRDRAKNGLVIETKWALEQLNRLSAQEIAHELSIDASTAKAFRKIRITRMLGVKSLIVDIDTTEPDAGVTIMEKLDGYVNKLPIVKQQIIFQKERLLNEKCLVDKILSNPSYNVSNVSENVVISDFLSSIYDLKKQKLQLTELIHTLEQGRPFRFSVETVSPQTPYKPKIKMLAFVGSIIGICSGIILAFILEWFLIVRHK